MVAQDQILGELPSEINKQQQQQKGIKF